MLRIKTKRQRGILWGLGAALCAVIVFGVVLYNVPSQTTNAAGETIVSSGPVTGRVNQQIAISGVSINGTGNATIPVNLSVTSGTIYMTTTTGLTFSTATSGASISFSGTRTNVNAALATLHYAGTQVGSDSLTVSLSGQNTIYNPDNGHVYQYIPSSGDWFAARDAAAASTYQGMTGYLATITSDAENQFIKDRLSGNAWLGGSDDAQYGGEGHWEWVTGPEAGTHIFNGQGSSGVTVPGQYTNWASGEPNNSPPAENCMETYISDGSWNDLPCDDSALEGYVVEYGDDTHTSNGIPNASVAITTTSVTFTGGDGTSLSPYQITDCEQLQDLNQDLSAHYVLTHDIDCTDTPNWNGGQGFVPIGSNHDSTGAFTGTIDGAGYSVDGLTEIRADDDPTTTDNSNGGADYASNQDYVGLIGYGNGLTVTNVHLTHAKIKGYMFVGGLVGFMSNGTITSSSVNQGLDESSDTSCTPGYCVWARYGQYGGGLVGYSTSGTITGSQVGGLVKGSGNIIGGLAGYTEYTSISDSGSTAAIDGGGYIGGAVGQLYGASSLTRVYATGNVIAKIDDEVGKVGIYAGGLVGNAIYGTIDQSYATGNVRAELNYAGGLAGGMSGMTLNDVYATGDVTADSALAGGLIGGDDSNTVSRAYASGHVTAGDNDAGGFVGPSYGDTISDSFATGLVASPYSAGAFGGDDGSSITHSHNFFDITTTGKSTCNPSSADVNCQGVNAANSQSKYFVNYTNTPFKQSGTQVWDINNIWYFDGVNLPVLRMGTNSLSSVLPADYDSDGVSTAVENAAPNNGDGNNDGIQDSEQANVASFVNSVTNKYVTLEVDDACSITAVTSAVAPNNRDDGYIYPLGLVHYTLDCGTAGFSSDVKIYYHGLSDASGFAVRKYNSSNNTYGTISSAAISGSNPIVVDYTIKDGSGLDEDGLANGTIVDPVGLGSIQPTSVVGAPNTGIQTIASHVVSQIAAALIGASLVGAAIFATILVRRYLK